MKHFSLTLLLSIVTLLTAHAELLWETTAQEFHTKPNEQQVIANFKFQNGGKNTIKITSVHPACGCTTATLKKDVIAPGEKGAITATFKIGERFGTQHKTITVNTDDADHPQTILTLNVFIPRILELQPVFLYWPSGEELKAKTVSVTVGADFPVKAISAQPDNPSITASVAPGRTPKDFVVTVTPADTSKPLQATIRVVPDLGGPQAPPFLVSVRVH